MLETCPYNYVDSLAGQVSLGYTGEIMEDRLAIREAQRLFRWSVAIRLVITALFLLMLVLRSPAGIDWTPDGRRVPPMRISPMLLVTVLAFTPWLERILGRYALAVLLALALSILARAQLLTRPVGGGEVVWHGAGLEIAARVILRGRIKRATAESHGIGRRGRVGSRSTGEAGRMAPRGSGGRAE